MSFLPVTKSFTSLHCCYYQVGYASLVIHPFCITSGNIKINSKAKRNSNIALFNMQVELK